MNRRPLGSSGLMVSEVGLGCNNFGGRIDAEASRSVIESALEAGINLFDTADVYGGGGGSEEILGSVLGHRRKDIFLATKFGMDSGDGTIKGGASARYIESAAEGSLKRLRTDWIDLYQLHTRDPNTPMEETLTALDGLVRAGKVRHIGCSNVPAWMVVDSLWKSSVARLPSFVSCQDEFSLVVRDAEKELVPMATAHGLGLLPYFPLASGLLTGKYHGGTVPVGTRIANSERLRARVMTEENVRIADRLQEFAERRAHTLLELAFGWLLSHSRVSSVIAGATKPEQIAANCRSAGWHLSAEEIAEVAAITSGNS